MTKLNLLEFFYEIKDENYCIIKNDDIDWYVSGSDIDIFCFNIRKIADKIISIGNFYIENRGYTIKITDRENIKQIYIDFYFNDVLDFRFDLYGELPKYKNLQIKNALFSGIIENRASKECYLNDTMFNIYIPSNIDNLIIRYIEYFEWFRERPDKIKHLDYIQNKLNDSKENYAFLDKLYYYVSLPNYAVELRKNTNINYYINKLKGKDIRQIITIIKVKVIRKIKNYISR